MSLIIWSIVIILGTSVSAWLNYQEISPGAHKMDRSSIIFPQYKSPFSNQNYLHDFANRANLHTQYNEAVNALFAVTTRLKNFLGRNTNKNFLVSPVSSTLAVAELLLGARGESRRNILNFLSYNETANDISVAEFHHQFGGLLKVLQNNQDYNDAYQLHVASAFFLNPAICLSHNFKNAITNHYGVELRPLDFSNNPEIALNVINQWAARHTKGVIKHVFSQTLPRSTAAVLTNAVYFKGDWEFPFRVQNTIPGKFQVNESSSVNVQYMRGQLELLYVQNERLGCRMIAIPYKDAKAAMYIILPEKNNVYDIQNFTESLSVQDVRELIDSARIGSVALILPKMTLVQSFSIREALLQYQNEAESNTRGRLRSTLFNINKRKNEKRTQDAILVPRHRSLNCTVINNSNNNVRLKENTNNNNCAENSIVEKSFNLFNMTGASSDERFQINDIVHNIFLEVSEVGTVAAAVGATTVDYFGEYKTFKIERPFLFFIRHEATGTPLFWGTIVDPTSEDGF